MTNQSYYKRAALLVAFILPVCVFAAPVEDNSFLIEEAYNQEEGVVQFIQSWQRDLKTNAWSYNFVNEIPVFSQAHQFSYEVPVSHLDSNDKTQLSDIKLNYRYEFSRSENAVVTGRVSATVPTGDSKKGFGSGKTGAEASLIGSYKITDKWVQHWNFGASLTPDAKNDAGLVADNSRYFWGVSNVYLMTDTLNFMLEIVGSQSEVTIATDKTAWESSIVVSPSLRYAIDYNEWQYVPGIALPIGAGANAGNNQVLVYLSIEGKMF